MDIKQVVAVIFAVCFIVTLIALFVMSAKYDTGEKEKEFLKRELVLAEDVIKQYKNLIIESESVEDIVARTLQAQKEWPEGEAQPVQRADEDDLQFQVRFNGYVIDAYSKRKITINKARELMGVPPYAGGQ